MATDESLLTNPPTPEDAVHVRDYTKFTTIVKWGAVGCFIIAIAVMFLIS